MLEILKALALNPTFRRFLVFIVTALAALLQKKLGLEVPADTVEMVVGLAIAYITGSNLKDALVAQAKAKQAATPAPSLAEAAAELSKPVL